jgi:hypothetical protein
MASSVIIAVLLFAGAAAWFVNIFQIEKLGRTEVRVACFGTALICALAGMEFLP